jgi:predicted metal-dependent hydrolase
MSPTDLPARRISKTEGGSTISLSVPAGVSDEEAWAEVSKAQKRIDRGYVRKLNRFELDRGLQTDVRWFAKQHPIVRRLWLWIVKLSRYHLVDVWSRTIHWFKYRWLDLYWWFKDRK